MTMFPTDLHADAERPTDPLSTHPPSRYTTRCVAAEGPAAQGFARTRAVGVGRDTLRRALAL